MLHCTHSFLPRLSTAFWKVFAKALVGILTKSNTYSSSLNGESDVYKYIKGKVYAYCSVYMIQTYIHECTHTSRIHKYTAHIHTYTETHKHEYTHTHTRTTHIHAGTHTCRHTYMQAHIQTHTHTHMGRHTRADTHARTHARTHTRTHAHTHTHKHTHTHCFESVELYFDVNIFPIRMNVKFLYQLVIKY